MGAGKAVAGIAAILVVASLLFTPVGHSFLDYVFDPSAKYPENAQYTMDRNISVTLPNEGMTYSVTIPKATDYVVDGITLQKVNSQSSVNHQEFSEYGIDWIRWNGTGLGTYISTISYDVECYTHVWDIDESNSLNVDYIQQNLNGSLSSMKPYLISDSGDGSEWIPAVSGWNKGYVIYTGGEVKELADKIVGDETNVYMILKLIYEWIDDNISYKEYGGIPQTALQLLNSKRGDCDDQSVLFCSLARAAGVPAWLEMGALYNTSKGTWINHVWAQAYIPTTEGGSKVTIDVVNDNFLAHTSRLFHLATDIGDGDFLNMYYNMYHYTYKIQGSKITTSDSYKTHDVNDSNNTLTISKPSRGFDFPSFFSMSDMQKLSASA